MLASDALVLRFCCNAFDFWHLRITKAFDQPEFYIGETVLHRINVSQGEILHPVKVIGLYWCGIGWIYCVQFPKNHPQFKPEDNEWGEFEEHQLEPMH